MNEVRKLGTELKPNDIVSVYWLKKGATLLATRMHPKYEEMFGISGAMIGNFAGREMTIDPQHMYTVFTA